MANHEDDLNWLYGKGRPASQETPEAPPSPQPRGGGYPDPGARRTHQETERAKAGGTTAPKAPKAPKRPHSTPASEHRRRRKHPVRRTIGVLFALLLAWAVFLIGTPLYAMSTTKNVDSTPSGDRPADQPGQTILLVGSDARSDLTAKERKLLGTGSVDGQRTDTMMLLNIPTQGPPVLLSLPRDSYVAIPGHNHNKLNAAYAFGGAPLLTQTVEQSTGIRVDGYMEVGMLGIVEMVDAVGGIRVCPKFDIDDKDAHLKMRKGCQQVKGIKALGYVRMRKADPRGDLGRVERQREVIGAIMKKAASPMTFINPFQYWALNHAAAGSLALGDGTNLFTLGSTAMGFMQVMSGAGISMTVPVANADYRTAAGSSVLWDEEAASQVFAAIAKGDTTDLEKYRQ